ncbi:hypothetical protein CFC21_102565 [Triticum aestivum]|uniref:SAM domain-containing protein n=3 Tax=Triticum TaxID=4564 RepID=A0A9R0ZYT4_TRITD|nr:ankyrin repeat and SAM domain-containing protein 6-like [Triticum dicoccoides]XP_044431458.1 ankyrin repeat and SAM domain-containing protein 6-like [Triticum aestivum]KAF7101171.1 hypothetical protein CFC21_102565 [Triticum aestivum]VAI86388.1 unnamed protein product [Triticum turgidum subsp. durum]
MYADRVSGRKRSVRDRLGSGGGGGGSRPRSDSAKRFRQVDGTWRRELYKDSVGAQSSSVPASRNLQAIQKSHIKQSTVDVKKSSVPDLREKLSGGQRPQLSSTVQIPKPAADIANSAKPVQKRQIPAAAAVAARPVTEQVNAPAAPKQSHEKADASLDRLLKSLDLEKYSINFQAEEVDMKALVHMNEEDMKSLGIPMGPRKKILSALASKRKKSSRSLPPTS